MKIAVIFTGGTIGSTYKGKWIGADDSAKYTLIEKYKEYDKETELIPFSPYTVLSENLSAKELNLLQKTIEEKLKEDFDGIIVTHGTDSLHYGACALQLAFASADIPVVLVSSAYPLENERENGSKNFRAAAELIKSRKAKGVFVSYKNENETKTNFHIPARMLQHSEMSADVYSIDGKIFAEYDGEIKILNPYTEEEKTSYGAVKYTEDSQILVVDSYPGNSFGYSLENVKTVILKPYHSATLDTANEKLHIFCRIAKEKNIPVYVVNVKNSVSYESTKIFGEIGIKTLSGTFVSEYMKEWRKISLRFCD